MRTTRTTTMMMMMMMMMMVIVVMMVVKMRKMMRTKMTEVMTLIHTRLADAHSSADHCKRLPYPVFINVIICTKFNFVVKSG